VKNPLQAMLEAQVIPSTAFPQNSRYYGFSTQTYIFSDGRPVAYLQRRLVPDPSQFAVVAEIRVKRNDRLDILAATSLGDPILFWRIADANGAIRPEDLVEVEGSIVRVTLPRSIPGASNA
jgi:hypothetical protein